MNNLSLLLNLERNCGFKKPKKCTNRIYKILCGQKESCGLAISCGLLVKLGQPGPYFSLFDFLLWKGNNAETLNSQTTNLNSVNVPKNVSWSGVKK